MGDIIDLFENGVSSAEKKGGAELREFIEGDRIKLQLGNLERGVKGPFFHGDKPTVTDFFLTAHVDWIEATLLNRLKAEKGADIFASYPKLYGVVTGVRNLDSYKNYRGPLKTMNDGSAVKDGVLAAY